jgi:hypothetical protein
VWCHIPESLNPWLGLYLLMLMGLCVRNWESGSKFQISVCTQILQDVCANIAVSTSWHVALAVSWTLKILFFILVLCCSFWPEVIQVLFLALHTPQISIMWYFYVYQIQCNTHREDILSIWSRLNKICTTSLNALTDFHRCFQLLPNRDLMFWQRCCWGFEFSGL